MHYLVDGYNLLFQLTSCFCNLQKERKTVLSLLFHYLSPVKNKVTIVFDSKENHDYHAETDYLKELIVVYTYRGQSADAYILERIELSKQPQEITVISNDRSLTAQARGLQAQSLTVSSFLSRIKNQKTKRKKAKETLADFSDSPAQIERLLKLFEQRWHALEKRPN